MTDSIYDKWPVLEFRQSETSEAIKYAFNSISIRLNSTLVKLNWFESNWFVLNWIESKDEQGSAVTSSDCGVGFVCLWQVPSEGREEDPSDSLQRCVHIVCGRKHRSSQRSEVNWCECRPLCEQVGGISWSGRRRTKRPCTGPGPGKHLLPWPPQAEPINVSLWLSTPKQRDHNMLTEQEVDEAVVWCCDGCVALKCGCCCIVSGTSLSWSSSTCKTVHTARVTPCFQNKINKSKK